MSNSLAAIVIALSIFLIAQGAEIPNGRIVGGFFAKENQFPYQVSLRYRGQHMCGGSILNEIYVLTAAHCVTEWRTPGFYSIGAGSSNLQRMQQSAVRQIAVHANYGNFQYDVALVLLDRPLTFSQSVQPIPMYTGELPDGADVVISGWGRIRTNGPMSQDLKYNYVKALRPNNCKMYMQDVFYPGLLCFAHPVNNGACNGDSGGPASYNNQLVGVANFVAGGCGSATPDGYAKVSYFINWVHENQRKLSAQRSF